MGKPKRVKRPKLTAHLNIRTQPGELAAWLAKAHRAHMPSVSSWIRKLANEAP